jgi:hypothetical protein
MEATRAVSSAKKFQGRVEDVGTGSKSKPRVIN